MHKTIYAIFGLILLTACANNFDTSASDPGKPEKQVSVKLKDLGPAPELYNETWLNTDQPLRLADLRGKVVLLEMWTFG